jgi:hypothetical protein
VVIRKDGEKNGGIRTESRMESRMESRIESRMERINGEN